LAINSNGYCFGSRRQIPHDLNNSPHTTSQGEMMRYQRFEEFIQQVAARNPGQPEFLQAVTEVIESLWPYIA